MASRRHRRRRNPETPAGNGRSGSPAALEVAPPGDLRAYRFDTGGDEFAVFEIPLPRPEAPGAFASLTAAEKSVLGLLLEGATNAAIAHARGTSVHTVANQVAGIFRKLDVRSRYELYARCARA
jgi:DNA-binding CsgD family transcriptional regulator